jgi:EmrB/QacA subfamily drug resistance transporter
MQSQSQLWYRHLTMDDHRQGQAAAHWTTSKAVLAIVSAGVILVNLDLFIVNVALPKIAQDYGSEHLSSLSWVLSGYAIVYAALLVLLGRLADRHNRRNAFLLAVAIFVAASAACGLADSLAMLVAFRVAQAVGAALLTPTSLGLVLATTSPERRQAAVRAWTAVGGIGAALGPVVGGLLVAVSWRWVFFVNVPIGIAALIAGVRMLPSVPGHPVPRPDALGALLVTGGVGALTLGLVEGRDWGWGSTSTIAVLAASLVVIAAFIAHCVHARNPLVSTSLFHARAYTGATFVATLFSIAFGGMLLSIVLWEQEVWQWSALNTGLSVAPGPLMVPLCSFVVAGRAIARYGPAAVSAVGAAVFAGGMAWWAASIGLDPDYVGDVLGGMVLTGVGVGLTLPTYMATAASSLPPAAFATGSAVINMLRQIGLAVGVAILVAILGSSGAVPDRLSHFQNGWIVIAAISLATAIASAVALPGRRHVLNSRARAAAPAVSAAVPD